MNGRQEGKLVTYICPTCGTALKFDSDKKSTVCPSCKNEVEKQFVVNINFASNSDDAYFKSAYSYDKSLFKFNFEEKKDILEGKHKREFLEIPSHRLTPNEMVQVDSLIQELMFKMDKPNKIKDTKELQTIAGSILCIDDNNVYGLFISNFLNNEPLTPVLSRRDSLDKANFFVPYIMTTNKVLYRTFDEDIDQIVTYVLNSNLKTTAEKFDCISSVFFEHLKEKHRFNDYAESVFTIASCDVDVSLKHNIVKKLADISLLNDYESFVKYIKVCQTVGINVDSLFSKNKLKCYIYGFKGTEISKIVQFIWSLETLMPNKRMDYITLLVENYLTQSNNLTAEECASLIDELKDKPFKQSKLKSFLERIVMLSMVEKVDIESIKKLENRKIKHQIKYSKAIMSTQKSSLKELWSFWKDYWWKKPFKMCCLASFLAIFILLAILNFEGIVGLFTGKIDDGMTALGHIALISFILFIPAGALINTIMAPVKWFTLVVRSRITQNKDLGMKNFYKKNSSVILKAENRNKELKQHEEFENARLIAYLVEVNLPDKLKKDLISLIKMPYLYEQYDEVLNLIDLISRSNYQDGDNLIKYLILNCINLNTYKEALTTLEFIKRLNVTSVAKDEFIKYLLYKKTKKSLTSVTGYLYLFSYLNNEVDRFKYMFSILCTYNQNLYYEMNNVDIAYASGDISDDIYMLVCKCVIRFALHSVPKDHLHELENNINLKLYNARIKEFTLANRVANSKIIRWVNKKPLTEKGYTSDSFFISYKSK